MAKEKKPTKQVFCDSCRQETEHTSEFDRNSEQVLTCTRCGAFIKLPANLSKEEEKEQLEVYKAANAGPKEVITGPASDEDLIGEEVKEETEETQE